MHCRPRPCVPLHALTCSLSFISPRGCGSRLAARNAARRARRPGAVAGRSQAHISEAPIRDTIHGPGSRHPWSPPDLVPRAGPQDAGDYGRECGMLALWVANASSFRFSLIFAMAFHLTPCNHHALHSYVHCRLHGAHRTTVTVLPSWAGCISRPLRLPAFAYPARWVGTAPVAALVVDRGACLGLPR